MIGEDSIVTFDFTSQSAVQIVLALNKIITECGDKIEDEQHPAYYPLDDRNTTNRVDFAITDQQEHPEHPEHSTIEQEQPVGQQKRRRIKYIQLQEVCSLCMQYEGWSTIRCACKNRPKKMTKLVFSFFSSEELKKYKDSFIEKDMDPERCTIETSFC